MSLFPVIRPDSQNPWLEGVDRRLRQPGVVHAFGGERAIRRFDDAYVVFIKAVVGGRPLTLRTEMPFSDDRAP
jgi:hypothetical protein